MVSFTLPRIAAAVVLAATAHAAAPPTGVYSLQNVATNSWLRHCYWQAFATPFTPNSQDFQFNFVPALSGADGMVSLQSINFPTMYLAVINGSFAESNRLGVIQSPLPADASFAVLPGLANSSAWSLQTSSGLYVTMNSGVLSGTCATSYGAPSGDVYLSDGSNKTMATWSALPLVNPITLGEGGREGPVALGKQ